jgi:hypothetical protein
MKKIVGVLLLSLTLLSPAHFALAASDDEKVMMRLERLEKQIQMLQSTVKVRMAEGKMMSGSEMKDVMLPFFIGTQEASLPSRFAALG